ncbi:hypothetical protein [Plantactinospora veratri]
MSLTLVDDRLVADQVPNPVEDVQLDRLGRPTYQGQGHVFLADGHEWQSDGSETRKTH